jgi:hypothetical protein
MLSIFPCPPSIFWVFFLLLNFFFFFELSFDAIYLRALARDLERLFEQARVDISYATYVLFLEHESYGSIVYETIISSKSI